MNKEIEINFKELERCISQMEFETNSIKIPDLKNKLLSSIDNNKARYEQLKQEISTEKNNELQKTIVNIQQQPKSEIAIEVKTKKDIDDTNEDKYTIKNVGFFISLIHSLKRKIKDPKFINQIKSINIKYILIAIFIFLLIFITLCYKIKRSNMKIK